MGSISIYKAFTTVLLWCRQFNVTLELDLHVAIRCIQPIAQDPQPLPVPSVGIAVFFRFSVIVSGLCSYRFGTVNIDFGGGRS